MAAINSISSSTLKELVASGIALEVTLVADSTQFRFLITYGNTETTLHAKRGHIRTFKNLERAVLFLHRHGIHRAVVEFKHLNALNTDASLRISEM